MNKRIQELAKQAEDWADNQNFYESDYRDYLMEKLVKLAVQACGDFTDPVTRNLMMKHFGVDS